MKKFIAIAACLCALLFVSSCNKQDQGQKTQGTFYYTVDATVYTLDALFDVAFYEAGCNKTAEGKWYLKGEKATCDANIEKAFLDYAANLDNTYKGILVLKGAVATLKVSWEQGSYELASYTFTK